MRGAVWWWGVMLLTWMASAAWCAGAEDALFLETLPGPRELARCREASVPAGTRLRRLNPAMLARFGEAPVPGANLRRLPLNLSGGEVCEVTLDEVVSTPLTRWRGRGRVENVSGSYVILANAGDALAGTVFLPGRGVWQICKIVDDWYGVVPVDPAAIPPCGVQQETHGDVTTEPPLPEPGLTPFFSAAGAPGGETNAVIDLLVAYTSAAREGAGGVDAMNALVEVAVAEANLALENSDARASLRLVYRGEVDYRETGEIKDDLDRMEDDSPSSPLYPVRILRGRYRADLVCLITERTGGPIGLANQLHTVEAEFGTKAFSVVKREYAISYQALIHEIGHNLGCQHDRATSASGGAFDFSHAYRFEVDGLLYHTIMAYQPGLPIPLFSNPDRQFLGVPVGIESSATNSADNARTIRLSAATAARFDSVMPEGVPPVVTLVSPTNGAVFTVPAVVDLVAEASDDDGRVVKVEFYVNGSHLRVVTSPPYVARWTNATPGTYTLRCEATDDAGWEIYSARARVTLNFAQPVIDLENSRTQPDGNFLVRVLGNVGQAFRLESSTNLVEWSMLTTDSLDALAFDFLDQEATNRPTCFYRVLPVP